MADNRQTTGFQMDSKWIPIGIQDVCKNLLRSNGFFALVVKQFPKLLGSLGKTFLFITDR